MTIYKLSVGLHYDTSHLMIKRNNCLLLRVTEDFIGDNAFMHDKAILASFYEINAFSSNAQRLQNAFKYT